MDEFIFYRMNEKLRQEMNLPDIPFPIRKEMEEMIFSKDRVIVNALIDELDFFLKVHPEHQESYIETIGLLSYIVGVEKGTERNTKQAIHYFEIGLTYKPDNLSLRCNYAIALHSLNLRNEALDQYEYIINDPEVGVSPLIWILAARLYSDMGDYDKAYQLLQACETFFKPDEKPFWDFYTKICKKMGKEAPIIIPSESLKPVSENGTQPSTLYAKNEPTPAYCANCGMEFGTDDIFCGHCGTRLNKFIVKGEDERAQGEQEEREEPARKAQEEARRKRRNQILAWVFVLGMLVVGLVMLLVFIIIMFLIADFYSI